MNLLFLTDLFGSTGQDQAKPLLAGVIESNLILCGEAVIILLIFYLLNRWLFVDLLALDKSNIIAKRIFILSGLFTFIIILVTTILEVK